MVADRPAHLIGVHLEYGRVIRAGAGDHHVVDRVGQVLEEPLQRRGIVGVEGGDAPGVDVESCLLQPLRISAGEDDLGALGAGAAGGLEPDAGAAADQDNGLAGQFRLGHYDRASTGWGAGVISARRALIAAT